MITLIGHGYVGKYIANELDKQKVKYYWTSHTDPVPHDTTFVINAAGYTGVPNVDACEAHRQQCIEGNVNFPLRLEQVTEAPVLHISSGCVYTGYTNGGWREYHTPNFNFNNGSFYSATKALFQELWLDTANKESYIFRIRMPFGADMSDKNLLTKLRKYKKLVNFENSVSNVQEVAEAAVFFALERPEPGIYNVVNPGSITTYQIAEMMGIEKEWFDHDGFMESVKAPRSNCVLNTDKMQAVFPLSDAVESLWDAIKTLDSARCL